MKKYTIKNLEFLENDLFTGYVMIKGDKFKVTGELEE